MPWRLIGFILIFGIFVFFIAFNLNNRCDINFWFEAKIPEVPVFLTVFSSFVLGMLCAIPFIVSSRRKRKEKGTPELPPAKAGKKKGKSQDIPELSPLPPAGEDVYGID
jgi:uncharacterized integral membrane protein